MNSVKKVLPILFLVVLIDQAGILMIVPILPELIGSLTGGTLAQDSVWAGWLTCSYALTQFVFAPIVGRLSDRFGRKPVLTAAMLFLAADYLVLALADNIWLLFIGRLLAGIPGASIATVMASVADIGDSKNRVRYFSIIYGAIGLGLVTGPVLTGVFLHWGLRAPFYAAFAGCLFCLLLIVFLLPETLRGKRQPRESAGIRQWLNFPLLRRPGMAFLFAGQFVTFTAFQAPMVLWAFFVMQRFGWDAHAAALSLTVFGVLYALVQFVVVPRIYPILKTVKTIYLGLFFFICGFVTFALAQTATVFYAGMTVYALGGITAGAGTNLFVMNAAENEQGQVQGMLSSVNSLASIAGPLLMTHVFYFDLARQTGSLHGGLPFVLGAVLLVVGGMLFSAGIFKTRSGN